MIGLFAGLAGIAFLPAQLFPPFGDIYARFANQTLPAKIPDLQASISMLFRGDITGEVFTKNAKQLGFSPEWSNAYFEANRPLLSALDVITAERREFIDRNAADAKLAQLGYSAEHYDLLRKLTLFYPSPNDLIMWQAREVFEPDSVAKYGLDNELENLTKEPFYKAGMDDEQIRNYWLAHWQHPSFTQIQDMLHRTDLTETDVWDWFKLIEVPPYWRDKFIQIAYKPYTRVDVRRMYRLGVMDVEDVYNAYLEDGYNDEKARNLTDFTVKYESDEDKGITRSAVIKAFKDDLITQEDLEDYLVRLEYPANVRGFWVQVAVHEKASELTDDIVSGYIDRYRLGELDLVELKSVLDTLDLSSMYVDSIIRKEATRIAVKLKLPTKADLADFLKAGLIDDTEWAIKMGRLGYREGDILMYLSQLEPTEEPPTLKLLTLATYRRLLRQGVISDDLFRDKMVQMGYEEADITLLLMEAIEERTDDETP